MTESSHKIKLTTIDNLCCSDEEVEFFVHLFTDTVEKMIPTLTREAWLKLTDLGASD